jgi:prevent-host-death family protein
MKKKVTAYEAKTHLPSLVAEAERGASITITRHGVAVAELGPVGRPRDVAAAIEGLKRLRRGRKLGKISIRQLIEEGRR